MTEEERLRELRTAYEELEAASEQEIQMVRRESQRRIERATNQYEKREKEHEEVVEVLKRELHDFRREKDDYRTVKLMERLVGMQQIQNTTMGVVQTLIDDFHAVQGREAQNSWHLAGLCDIVGNIRRFLGGFCSATLTQLEIIRIGVAGIKNSLSSCYLSEQEACQHIVANAQRALLEKEIQISQLTAENLRLRAAFEQICSRHSCKAELDVNEDPDPR